MSPRSEEGGRRFNDYIQSLAILLATSLSRHGSRLVLWLMARLLMCLGSAPKTWLLPVVLVAAFSIVLTSDALAVANAPADEEQRETGGGREFKMSAV